MSSSPIEYLRHMLGEADYIVGRVAHLRRDQFLGDETLQRAFVRSIEVIGEATKHIPDEFRSQHPEIEWRAMAGMRDRLIFRMCPFSTPAREKLKGTRIKFSSED
jgi:uncharacterized protein with HEPN domain